MKAVDLMNEKTKIKAFNERSLTKLKTKCVKDAHKSTNNNIIHIHIRFVDESLKTLLTDNITFENNILTKPSINKLKNITYVLKSVKNIRFL